MKELYIGMAVIALILITLSITMESSYGKYDWKDTKKYYNNNTDYELNVNNLKNNKPSNNNIPNVNNHNTNYLKRYYNNNYFNNDNAISKKFFV